MQSSLLQTGFRRNSWEIEADDCPSCRRAIHFGCLTFQEWSRNEEQIKRSQDPHSPYLVTNDLYHSIPGLVSCVMSGTR